MVRLCGTGTVCQFTCGHLTFRRTPLNATQNVLMLRLFVGSAFAAWAKIRALQNVIIITCLLTYLLTYLLQLVLSLDRRVEEVIPIALRSTLLIRRITTRQQQDAMKGINTHSMIAACGPLSLSLSLPAVVHIVNWVTQRRKYTVRSHSVVAAGDHQVHDHDHCRQKWVHQLGQTDRSPLMTEIIVLAMMLSVPATFMTVKRCREWVIVGTG